MKKALIVVDMLNDFINPNGDLFCGPTAVEIVPNVVSRVLEYRKAGYPVFFLADNHDENDKEFKRFPKHCIKDTEGARLIKAVGWSEGDYLIAKKRYSGFFNTDLEISMIMAGLHPDRTTVEVCGVCTSICIMDTIGDLANRDYPTVVHRNCVADFDPEMHNMALKRMSSLYGTEII